MTVLISEQHMGECAVVVAYFKTRPLNESEYNLARLLQGALIAGDSQAGPSKNARALRAIGGKLTAQAGRDYSYFCTLISSKNLNDGLAVQADMLLHPSLSSDSAARAALALQADNARWCEDPAGYSYELVSSLAASSLESSSSSLAEAGSAAAQERLSDFYKSYYRPENLVLSVVGDVSTFDTLVQIERLYGDFGAAEPDREAANTSVSPPAAATSASTPIGRPSSGQKPPEPAPQQDSSSQSPRLLYLENRGKISQSIVTVGYRTPGFKSDDWPALLVLATLLGQGGGSALKLTLFFNQGVVNQVSSDFSAGPNSGLLSIQLWLPPAGIDKAEASLFKEIDRIIKAQPDPSEIARARSVAEIGFSERVETFTGAALMMASHGASSEGIPTAAALISRIRSVRPEDVQLVAAKYLGLSNASIHEYEPSTAPARTFDSGSFARTVLSWAPGLAQSANLTQTAGRAASPASKMSDKEKAAKNQAEAQAEAEAQNVQPLPVRDFSTLNGPKVFVREDHSRPQVTIAILFQGGRLSENEANAGITDLMLRVLLYGTPRITRDQAAMALDKLGADVTLVNESDYFGFLLTCLSANAGEALRFLRNLIEVSSFRDSDVERAKQEQVGLIRATHDSQRERSRSLMLEAMFPGHPYSIGPHGLEPAIVKLKTDDLRDWYSKTIKSQFPLAVIVGDTDGSALVSEAIAGEFKRRDLADTFKARIPGRPSNVEKAEQGRCPVTIQYIGFSGHKLESGDLGALYLIQESLNGLAGGFAADLVYKQRVASTVWLGYSAMAAGGVVYACIESAPDDWQRARAATISELQQISTNGLSAGELDGARALAATSAHHVLAAQRQRALAYAEAIYARREASYVDTFAEALGNLSAADVKRVAAAYLKPAGYSVGVLNGIGSPKQRAAPTN
jgi:predicted Zn-dependent peptidase